MGKSASAKLQWSCAGHMSTVALGPVAAAVAGWMF